MKNILQWLLRQLKRLVIFRDRQKIAFEYVGFLISYTLQSLVLLTVIGLFCSLVFPATFAAQFNHRWYVYAGWALWMVFYNSGFEWWYHRYILHKVSWRLFASQKHEHTHHHKQTDFTHKVNDYPITRPHQTESATFPWYALMAFWGVFTVLMIAPLQLLFPGAPILISCYPAVTFSLVLYETYHAAMHLDYDKHWRKSVEKYQWVYRLYAFHYMHHANEQVNQAIGGFFGLPIWDWMFKTYYLPKERLPLPDQPLSSVLNPPKPWGFVRRWDENAKDRQKRNSKIAYDKDQAKRAKKAGRQT